MSGEFEHLEERAGFHVVQGSVLMSATPAVYPEVAGPPRLEVRWIHPGVLDRRVLDWFARFPTSTESRVDYYLADPDIDGLSVKVRAGRTLEIKVQCGSRGELVLPGRARGYLESWQRWSFHDGRARWADVDSPAWTAVSKVRRMCFVDARGNLCARAEHSGREIGCAVELTDIATLGRRWWTLGFEATGPDDDLPGLLERTAAIVLTEPLPDGKPLRSQESTPYSRWLRDRVR